MAASDDRVTLTIDGTAYTIGSISGREAINEHFRIRAMAQVEDAATPPADLVGKPASIAFLTADGQAIFTITGIVRSVDMIFSGGPPGYELEIGPAAELFEQGQDSAVFLALSSPDIAAKVLKNAGLASGTDFKFANQGSPPVRDYTAQYREPCFAFVDRIVREDGIYWFYDHTTTASVLTFMDDSTQATALAQTFTHQRTNVGNASRGSWISDILVKSVVATTKFSSNDRDPQKPALDLSANATDGTGDLEVYSWPARALTTAGVTAHATTALKAHRARRRIVQASTRRMGVVPGKIMNLTETNLPFEALLIISTEWTVDARGLFRCKLEAIPSTTPFLPPWRKPGRAPLGPETAFVVGPAGSEIASTEQGNVSTQAVWDRLGDMTDKATIPIRVGQAELGESMAIPRIGWSIVQAHHDDDIDRAWVERRLVDGTHPAIYKLPDNMTMTSWQTLTSTSDGSMSQIVFEDKQDAEQIVVHASKDMSVTINDNEARTIGNRHVLEVDGDRSVEIDADEKLVVIKDQTTTVKGNEKTSIDGNRSLTVKGAETNTLSAARTESVTADRTIDVGGNRSLTVSGNASITSTDEFTREIVGKHTITGAQTWTTQCDGGLTITTKGNGEETVGAARSTTAKGIQTLVKGDFTDAIAAGHTVTAKGNVGETAKGKMTLDITGALSGMAPTIEISADSEITIACGPATISIKDAGVEIKAPTLVMAGPMIVLDGATVKHNP